MITTCRSSLDKKYLAINNLVTQMSSLNGTVCSKLVC